MLSSSKAIKTAPALLHFPPTNQSQTIKLFFN